MAAGNGSGTNHVGEVLRHGKAIRSETEALANEVNVVATQAKDFVLNQLETRPYRTLAVAAGVGYVLGGGLFSRFSGNLIRLGLKVAVVPMLKSQLMALGEAATEGALGVSGRSGFQQGYAGPDGTSRS